MAARDMMSLRKPTSRDYTSVKNYFDGTDPVVEEECYIHFKEDVVTLKSGREHAWLDGMIEIVLKKFECRFLRWLFCSPVRCQIIILQPVLKYNRRAWKRTMTIKPLYCIRKNE